MNAARITQPRAHLFILVLILALAAALRFNSLSALGFWTDEFCALSAANAHGLQLDQIPLNQITPALPSCTHLSSANSFWKIPGTMARNDAHPPVYFMLLRLWEDLFGDSESAVRSLNVVFSLIAIALLYFAAIESVEPSTALTACLLMAVATPQIQYSQEARNYMPVLVFSLLAFLAIAHLGRSPGRFKAIVLAVSFMAMMLTHYFAAGVAAGLALHAMLRLRKHSRIQAAIAITIAGLGFIVLWGRWLLQQRAVMHAGSNWLDDSAPGHLHRRLLDLARLPVRFFVEITDPRSQILIAIIGTVLLLGIPILFVRRRELRPWIYWLISAIGIVFVVDLARSTTQLNWVRYSLFATPPAYVLLAAALRGRLRFVLPAVAGFAALICLSNGYVPAWKIDFRTPVQKVGNRLGPDDGLVIAGPDPIADGIMYAAFKHYVANVPVAIAVLTGPPQGATLSRLQQCPKVGVIWLWPDRTIAGFEVQDQGTVPYFGTIMIGKFRPPAATRN